FGLEARLSCRSDVTSSFAVVAHSMAALRLTFLLGTTVLAGLSLAFRFSDASFAMTQALPFDRLSLSHLCTLQLARSIGGRNLSV
ncbi:hypothetical protein AVEN_4043-1, partial [Araneus ventricosus]